mgnify:CR=1 FL=1
MPSTVCNDQFLDSCRQLGDNDADNLVEFCFANEKQNDLYSAIKFSGNNQEFKHLEIFNFIPLVKNNLFLAIDTLDNLKLSKGTIFFQQYEREILFLLGSLSLPYCYAAAKGAKVLCFSDRIISNPEKRLSETASFVMKVMEPDAFLSTGNGIVASIQVRLIHAMVRYHIRKSNKWVEFNEIPINQEDMAGTNLSFSLIILRGLRKMGIRFTDAEAEAYLYLWSVVGRFTGVKSELLIPNRKFAFDLEKKISERHFSVSYEGQLLTKSLVTYLTNSIPVKIVQSQQENIMFYLLGDKVSQILGIKKTGNAIISELLVSNVRQLISETELKRMKQQLRQISFS